MIILELHFAASVLVLLTFAGVSRVFNPTLKANGWLDIKRPKKPFFKRLAMWCAFFVPLVNLMLLAAVLFMVLVPVEEAEELLDHKFDFEEVEK